MDEAQCIRQYRSLVVTIAKWMMRRLPRSIAYDDLIQEGLIGLLHAHRRYQADRGVTFQTFASHRIRGAMRDHLRALDPLSRDARRALRAAERADPNPATFSEIFEREASYEDKPVEFPAVYARLDYAVRALPEQHKYVIRAVYWRDSRKSEIAEEWDLTQSRVVQIHGEALRKLKRKLSIKPF